MSLYRLSCSVYSYLVRKHNYADIMLSMFCYVYREEDEGMEIDFDAGSNSQNSQ